MADQDWKRGPLNRAKYLIHKRCTACGGKGVQIVQAPRQDTCCPGCDGEGYVAIDEDAAYFVLRIDHDWDPHAQRALACYADSVESDNAELAADIRQWLAEVSTITAEGRLDSRQLSLCCPRDGDRLALFEVSAELLVQLGGGTYKVVASELPDDVEVVAVVPARGMTFTAVLSSSSFAPLKRGDVIPHVDPPQTMAFEVSPA